MRFMILVKASNDSEKGVMPTEKILTEMGKFNEELAKAGILLAGEGLQPSSKGARVKFSGTQRTVTDGPFTPNPMPSESEIEIRQVFEASDFGAELTPELREQEERVFGQAKQQAAAKQAATRQG